MKKLLTGMLAACLITIPAVAIAGPIYRPIEVESVSYDESENKLKIVQESDINYESGWVTYKALSLNGNTCRGNIIDVYSGAYFNSGYYNDIPEALFYLLYAADIILNVVNSNQGKDALDWYYNANQDILVIHSDDNSINTIFDADRGSGYTAVDDFTDVVRERGICKGDPGYYYMTPIRD